MRVAVIGDSVNIDTYPNIDANERFGGSYKRLGAGSLLYKNNNTLFPEFEDSDLYSQCPDNQLKFYNLGSDGGTIGSIPRQVARIRSPQELDWLFVTIGGNDLLLTFSNSRVPAGMTELGELMGDYSDMVRILLKHFPKAKIVLATVYDPTDGTGLLSLKQKEPLPIEYLTLFNDLIKRLSNLDNRLSVVDIHKHFLGQGISAMMAEDGKLTREPGLYWPTSIIEPNIYGASKVRELWLAEMGIKAGKLWQPALSLVR